MSVLRDDVTAKALNEGVKERLAGLLGIEMLELKQGMLTSRMKVQSFHGAINGYERGAAGLEEEKQQRNRDLDPQLVWRGKDEQDWSDLVVHTPPLYIQEKVHPKALIDDMMRTSKESEHAAGQLTADLFADFNGIPKGADKTEFYQHDQNWSNRMILGDSLQVMASLAEREGLRGKVQCIYLDPPYGIRFNSNFQWSTTSRDVKDGNAAHITREPEQVKAFRDTWRDGIHSYLTYLRDRLTVARDLLTDSGSIFVQIGDENVHRVRAMMDEVFGESNYQNTIYFTTTGGLATSGLTRIGDYVVWYAKDASARKHRPLFVEKKGADDEGSAYKSIEIDVGLRRRLTAQELAGPPVSLPRGRVFRISDPWPEAQAKLHADWWQARIARQKEIDASIAAKAEFEYLYDKPYENKKIVRVAGPFTVESLSPHRVLGVDENDDLIDPNRPHIGEPDSEYAEKQSFPQMILENLKVAGVQQAHKEDRIVFTSLKPWPGELICAEGRYIEGGGEKRAGIFIGPEFGTVTRPDLVAAAREAGDADFDVLIACAFNYEVHATEFSKLGRIPVLKARMNADLHMAEDLKATGKGNLFVIFGEPDITILDAEDGKIRVRVNGVDVFHPQTGEVRSDGPEGIACWFIDTDYNEESFFVRHAYFLGAKRSLQCAKDDAEGRNQRRGVGDAEQRYVTRVSKTKIWSNRGEGDQPPGRRGDEGVSGGLMEFRIADTFTDSLARLTGDEQKAVKTTAFDLQLNPANPGMSFHKLDKARDKNFWSVRAGSDIRLIVHKTAGSLLLCYVDHHDRAYDWAERRKLETHPKTGAAQLAEIRERVEEIRVPKYIEVPRPVRPQALLFAQRSDEELLRYGVPPEWLADVREADEDTLLELAGHLPAEAAEALLELATGGPPQVPRPAPVPGVDPFAHPDAQRRFRVVGDVEQLARALEFPWDKWTIFLHPAQRELVERDYSGPARVSGSAGTGKTIVALHRAVFLARVHPDSRVLLATFSDTLANALRTKLRRLISNEPRLAERLEVHAMDAIGEKLYERRFGRIDIVSRGDIRDMLAAADEVPSQKFSLAFLHAEWDELVDAWQLDSWEAYRDVRRLGRKIRLPEAQRAALWAIFEAVRTRLREDGRVTRATMFSRLAAELASRKQPPFEFVVVDESQDLSPPQLRFLAALGADRPNGLFFAGDLGQRIFQQPFSWKSLGVDIRGRARTLHVNYRTSHQIRTQADRLLAPDVSDVDGNTEERRGTISVFNGAPPLVQVFATPEKEIEGASAWINERAKEGVAPREIGVFVRSDAELGRARQALAKAGMPYEVLDANVETSHGHASLCTMHLAKGLEFRAVVVMACDDEVIPLQSRIESVTDDSDLEEVYDTERHLLYVACTRARPSAGDRHRARIGVPGRSA